MLPKAAPRSSRVAAVAACFWGALWTGCDPPGAQSHASTQSSSLAIPCDANLVLQDVCQHCHSSPPQNGAPFSLVTYEDTQVLASGEPLWKYMRAVVSSGAMPLPPVQISSEQRDMLLAWFDAGAPPRTGSDMCTDPSVDDANADVDTDGATLDSPGDDGEGGLDSNEGGNDSDIDASEVGLADSGTLEDNALPDSDAASCDAFNMCATDSDDGPTE